MEKLKVVDIINSSNAILHKFGIEVYEDVSELINEGKPVELSFTGVNNLTSGFCNAAIGNVYQNNPKASDLLNIIGVNDPIWESKIDSAIELASDPHKKSELDSAILELFA